ncbi:MAG TPA: LamG domain-containing protein, partial [Solirubrobacterales bacterium]|nr:LamG domain-containing protein [Solirubrobacterales bacterium]
MGGWSGIRGRLAPAVGAALLLFAFMMAAALRPDGAEANRPPVAAYSFDAGHGEVAEDLVGENDGALEGATWFDNGRYGKALLFDGEETCVTVPHAADLQLSEEMTVEAWVRPHDLSDQPVIYKSAWGNLGYALGISYFNTAKPEGLIGEGPGKYEDVVSPDPVAENVWTHLAFTYDGATMRLYVNGELVATQAQSTPPPAGEGPLAIGCNPLYPEDFDGLIDEVRIYDRALGVDEVVTDARTWLESPARGPVAAYSLDTGEGAVAEDLVGGHDGAIEGATWFDKGKYAKALSFDGVDDCVSVEDAPELQLTEDFTLQAWVKPKGEVKADPIIFKENEGFFSYYLGLGLASSGKVEAYIGEEEEDHTLAVSPEPLTANVWAHVAVTYDGARMRLYLNGDMVDTNATGQGNLPSSGPLQIGCADIFNEHFNGLIDEPRLYDRALGAEEIALGMRVPLPATATTEAYGVDATEAVLVGKIGSHNEETEYRFEYGTTPAYGNTVPEMNEDIVLSDEDREVEEAIFDLE